MIELDKCLKKEIMNKLSPIWKKAQETICNGETYIALPLIQKLHAKEELQLKNKSGYTLFHYAIITNNIEICFNMLMFNCNVSKDIVDKYKIPPLFLAIIKGNYEISKLLIEYNKDIINYKIPTKEKVYKNSMLYCIKDVEHTILDSALCAVRGALNVKTNNSENKFKHKEIYELIIKYIDKEIITSHLEKLKGYMFDYYGHDDPYKSIKILLEECLKRK